MLGGKLPAEQAEHLLGGRPFVRKLRMAEQPPGIKLESTETVREGIMLGNSSWAVDSHQRGYKNTDSRFNK
jgi:hypothetical protein